LDAEIFDEGDGTVEGVAGDRLGRFGRVPEGVDDEGEPGEVDREFAIEAAENDRGGFGEVDLGVVPGDPEVVGSGGEWDGSGWWVLAERAEDFEHGGDVGLRRKVGFPVRRLAASEDEEEAFEQAVLLFAAEPVE
jgi:hypothetical protein